MNKKMHTAVLAVVALLLGAACEAGGSGAPEGSPSPVDDGTSCSAPGPVPGPPSYDPYSHTRPPDVRPGNSWVVFELTVLAVGMKGELGSAEDYNYCIPVAVHVYTRSGETDAVSLDNMGFEPGPYDLITTTPWQGEFVALQYDPTDPRFVGRPPDYAVYLNSIYLSERDMVNQATPMALRCSIWNRGVEIVKHEVSVSSPGSGLVSCGLIDNRYWNLY